MRTERMFLTYLVLTLFPVSSSFASSIMLQWDPNSEADLAGYKIYYKANSAQLPFDGAGAVEGVAPIDVANQTTATVTGLDPGTDYYFAVTAYNTSGMESGYSDVIAIPKVTDTSVPTVSLSSPVAAATVSGVVGVTASASDDIGVSRVDFYANDTLIAASNVSPYSYNWDTTAVPNGAYTVVAKAYDAAGNNSAATVQVVVVNDTTAPTVAVTSPSAAASVGGAASVTVSAADDVELKKVELYINGILQQSSTTSPMTFNWDTAAISNGAYTLSAKAYDAVGNVGRSADVTVTVFNDLIAPTISSLAIPATAATSSVAVTVVASDNVAVAGYLVSESSALPSSNDSRWTTSAASTFTFSGEGTHTIYAWAKDAAGNVSTSRSASVTISFTDTTAPTINSFSMPGISTSTTVPVTSFSAADDKGVTGFIITETSSAPSASAAGWNSSAPTTFTFTAAGSRTAYAWVKDAAGNVSTANAATVVVDSTPPSVATPSVRLTGQTLTVAASATDNMAVAKMELYLDSNLKGVATESTISLETKVGKGTHTVLVKAYDAAGNMTAQSATVVR